MNSSPSTGICIKVVRIYNFRSLCNVEVPLGALTVLVGANNAGKTSFLDAMYAAIGAGRWPATQQDVFIDSKESVPPRDRVALIDILIRPVDNRGKEADNFGEASFWTNLWGNEIYQDEDMNDFVAIRTTISHSLAHDSYVIERSFLKEWKPFSEDWPLSETSRRVSAAHIEPIQLQYIDAKRDLEDDLRRAGSFWRRLTENLGLADSDIEHFEAALSTLNSQIIDKSAVLKHLKVNLADLHRVVADDRSEIDISPVARRLRDLSKGVDVTFSSEGSQAFPLTRHGMGTRSLASLLVFRAFASWKALQAAEQDAIVHSLLALEEPEAHLHPQAQRALHRQICTIPGQRLVSTHSPYFAGQAELQELRLFTKSGPRTHVRTIHIQELNEEDHRKLKRSVIATRGDILFSKALVLIEGETEEQALPIWAEKYWSASVHELGINFVGVDGHGNYFPFIWLAHNFGIEWFILSDGEELTLNRLDASLKRSKLPKHEKCKNIVVMDKGKNFESQLLLDGYRRELGTAVQQVRGGKGLDDFIAEFHGLPGKKGVLRDYKSKGGPDRALIDCISADKTRYGPIIAEVICSVPDDKRRFPSKVRALLEKILPRLRKRGENVRKERKTKKR